MERRVGHEVPSLAKELLGIVSCSKRVAFSKTRAPDKLTTCQWNTTYPRISGQHNLALMGKKKTQSWVRREGWMDLGRAGGEGVTMVKHIV